MADGILVVDKPAGWTSHDVVARVRRLAGTRRVGHAGTLDPMATGVLVLGVDRGTKLLTYLVGCDKTYAATVRLGQSTVTDDAEGDVIATVSTGEITEAAIHGAVATLTGPIIQVPSSVSAIKVDGRRSYARVRAGEQVELAPRPVTVHRFDVAAIGRTVLAGPVGPSHPVVDLVIEVDVSSGTYVRALARDLGVALGVGGHLTALRRLRVGCYDVGSAHPLAELEESIAANGTGAIPLLSLADAAAAQFDVRALTVAEAEAVVHGRRIASAAPGSADPVAAIGPDGTLVALLDESRPQARTHVVFAPG